MQFNRRQPRDHGQAKSHIGLFTDPELARIGLSETEAEAQG